MRVSYENRRIPISQIDKYEELLEIAQKENIRIDYRLLDNADTFVVEYEPNQYAIAIDPSKVISTADENVKLAHELGHCMTKAIYSRLTPLETRERCEHKANAWAIKQLIPWEELKIAFRNGLHDTWELTEYFDVTPDFMQLALDYYILRKRLCAVG